MSKRITPRESELDPAREFHTGQRRVNGRINRPDTRKHPDYTPSQSEDSSCIRRGVHTRTF